MNSKNNTKSTDKFPPNANPTMNLNPIIKGKEGDAALESPKMVDMITVLTKLTFLPILSERSPQKI
jgi:hypothetical protein